LDALKFDAVAVTAQEPRRELLLACERLHGSGLTTNVNEGAGTLVVVEVAVLVDVELELLDDELELATVVDGTVDVEVDPAVVVDAAVLVDAVVEVD
jgi:hypothetical protein